MLSANGFTMSIDKVQTIQDWPKPQKVKDIQSFLSFADFYCRFIYNYSDITVLLTRLTRNGNPWAFTEECRGPFNYLNKAFTLASILSHWVPNRPMAVETNTSDYALGTILSLFDDEGVLNPVAFHSQTFTGAKLNYDVHDKELLAIFEAFQHWRHYLEGSSSPIDVVTDHKNFEYFATMKLLT
jgi:RNase H-like domain found in reverse transcriptase